MKRICFFLISVSISLPALFAQKGTIRGVVSDKATGELLIGVTVALKNIGGGTLTDLDGNYQINLEPGQYDLAFNYTGYAVNTITGIEVKANEVTVIDVSLETEFQGLTEVVITAVKIDNTENSLLSLQRRANTIQDGISSQEITRYGSSNAAESMKRVTGASVVDGKYVVVRGLGDRYSATQLNGLPLPSTDPYRNSTQLDLIPANLIDNMVASKTFTPNLPGNFTGGNVDIKLKNFPDRFSMSFSVSSSFNDQSSFNENYLTHDGGKTDWLGFDDGSRKLSGTLTDPAIRDEMTNSLATRARKNDELARLLDQSSKSVNYQFGPYESAPLTNHGASFSIGNQYNVMDNPFGVLLALNYNKRYDHYSDGEFKNWALNEAGAPELALDRDLTETRSTETPQLGGLLGLSYKFAGTQKISFNTLYNHEGEKDSRYLNGPFPAILSSGIFESRSVLFKERAISSYQLAGEHVFGKKEFRIDWSGGYVQSDQTEPDLRFFANSYAVNAADDTSYFILPSEYPLPFHFFRDLKDRQWIGKIDFTVPFLQSRSKANKIEFGALYQAKDRNFMEDRFQYQRGPGTMIYDGDPSAYFAESNRGNIGFNETTDSYIFGLFLTDVTDLKNSYKGKENISAGYGMITYDWSRIKIIAGARVENTDMEVVSADTTKDIGRIDKIDLLPSVNLIYRLNEEMNLRASYSNTLARPNMRELAPFSSFEFIGDFLYTGNPNLRRTRAQNYDLRWEWFPNIGEVIAVSGYYKNFNDPIVQVFVPEAPNKDEIKFENVSTARVYGAEFEFRKNLGFLTDFMRHFRFTSNLSFIYSEVEIPEAELLNIEEFNPEKGDTRPFQGQSPFLLNASLNYVNPDRGIDAILSVNVFGTRLDAASFGGRPDVYEQTRPQLDFSVQKRIGQKFGLKITALNLLDPVYRKTMEYKGKKYTIQEFERGRTYGISLSYNI